MKKFSLDFSVLSTEDILVLATELSSSESNIAKTLGNFLKEWLSESDVIVAHTSGSTGVPKPIILQKTQVRNSALTTGAFFKLQKGQTALLCLSPQFIAGKMMVVRALIHQMKLVVVEPSATPLEQISEPIHFAAMVPNQLFETVHSTHGKQKLENIQQLIIGGGAIPQQLEQATQDIPTNVYATYGMTETISHIALRKANGEDRSEWFTPFPSVKIWKDERDCLVIDAPNISSETILTNDIIELSTDGKFKILGRIDNVINTGGIKINPEEIEEHLSKFIQEPFIVSSIPDEKFGNKLILIVEGKLDQAEIEKINKIIASELSSVKRPKEIFVLEKFIRTETGKTKRLETTSLLGRVS